MRAFLFGNKLVIVARTTEEAMARFVKNGGAEGEHPLVMPVRFAY